LIFFLALSLQGCPHEVLSSVEYGASITGGGGFSATYDLPPWQSTSVSNWLNTCPQPSLTFDSTKRAYPDVAVFGHGFGIVINGKVDPVDGTSASSPSFAGAIALINDLRFAQGLKPLGFLNPLLYQAQASDSRTFNDIQEGSNRCLNRGSGCCTDGFQACPGFDPATGLGSPNFFYLSSYMGVSLANITNDWPGMVNCTMGPAPPKPTNNDNKKWIIIGAAAGGALLILLGVLFICWRRSVAARKARLGLDFQHMGATSPIPSGATGGTNYRQF
jgi:hypothetical protein